MSGKELPRLTQKLTCCGIRGKKPGCGTYEFAFTVGRVRFVLEAETFLGVTVGDFQAVRFADGNLVEPSARLGYILEGVVHRIQNAVSACVRKFPLLVM